MRSTAIPVHPAEICWHTQVHADAWKRPVSMHAIKYPRNFGRLLSLHMALSDCHHRSLSLMCMGQSMRMEWYGAHEKRGGEEPAGRARLASMCQSRRTLPSPCTVYCTSTATFASTDGTGASGSGCSCGAPLGASGTFSAKKCAPPACARCRTCHFQRPGLKGVGLDHLTDPYVPCILSKDADSMMERVEVVVAGTSSLASPH